MTPRTTERVAVDGPAGPIEAVHNVPETALRGIALVCHPHPLQGGTLDNKVVQTLAKTFFGLRYAAVRFNFRGVGRSAGAFDEGRGETDDALAVLGHARRRFGEALPVVLAGFSFGAYVVVRMSAQGRPKRSPPPLEGEADREAGSFGGGQPVTERVQAERLVLVGPAVGRFPIRHVPDDTIVIHGEEDDVVPLADVFAWARPQALPIVVFPGCGHFFHGRLPQLARIVTSWWTPPKPGGAR
jgi:alpha/beta superfamily hydrolase